MTDLLIKAEELNKLLQYLDTIPHSYGKNIEAYLIELRNLRTQEAEPKEKAVKPAKAVKGSE